MKGKFFAVGVGPGDPELITLKAINTMKNSDVIAVPRSGASENIALKIAGAYIEGKTLLECDMPMIKDKEQLDRYHDQSAMEIGALLSKGKTVSFLTLGDPAIYSTVMYVHRRLTEQGFDTAIIPASPPSAERQPVSTLLSANAMRCCTSYLPLIKDIRRKN